MKNSANELTLSQALAELEILMQTPENIQLSDLEAIVSRVSVVDTIAGENAVTYLYSGSVGNDRAFEVVHGILESEGSNARALDRKI